MILFDFRNNDVLRWSPIDDVVMGGMSFSRIEPTGRNSARFFGMVSLENNGGFASVVSPDVRFDLSNANGLALHIYGDGKLYGFVIRCANNMRIRYQAQFFTEPNVWETVYLPFSRFQPMIFGTILAGAPPMNISHITSCGLIISEKQFGEFTLELAWIASYPV